MFSTTTTLLAAATFFLTMTSAHTWNEQFAIIGSNGSYVGAYGYPRGYFARGDTGWFSQDYLVPQLDTYRTRANASDLLCHPAQRTPNQNANWPRLTVAPGSAVAMKYLENGHVSLPENIIGKPPSGGTVFVFGTTQPYDDETLFDVMAWTRDGSGGDKRGYLLAANNYDDGRCHQLNSGAISLQRQQQYPDPFPGQPESKNELWCETDVVLPTDTSIMPVGKLFTIYWVWQWPTAPGSAVYPTGKDEYYTTCSDFEVAAEEPNGALSNLLTQQDPNTRAVNGYLSRTAITPIPIVFLGTQTSSMASSFTIPLASSISTLDTSTMPTSTTLVSTVPSSTTLMSSMPISSTTVSSTPVSTTPVSTAVLQVIPVTPNFLTLTMTTSDTTTSTITSLLDIFPSSSSTSSTYTSSTLPSSTSTTSTSTISPPTSSGFSFSSSTSSSYSSSAITTSQTSSSSSTSSPSTSSSRSMVTLTITVQNSPFTGVIPSSTSTPLPTTFFGVPDAPQVNPSGGLVFTTETTPTTPTASSTPVLLTAVVTLTATLQPDGSVDFGGYPQLEFKGASGQTVNVGG